MHNYCQRKRQLLFYRGHTQNSSHSLPNNEHRDKYVEKEVFQNVRLCPRKLSNEELLLLDKVEVGHDKLPIEAYFRLLLPALFPKLNRIIYMDVDILVNQSLAELWDQDLDGKFIGAVLELEQKSKKNYEQSNYT